MPKTECVPYFSQDWIKAVHQLSAKHQTALMLLDMHGYEPVYITRVGTYVVLGRTIAYEAMRAEGYWYDDSVELWIFEG